MILPAVLQVFIFNCFWTAEKAYEVVIGKESKKEILCPDCTMLIPLGQCLQLSLLCQIQFSQEIHFVLLSCSCCKLSPRGTGVGELQPQTSLESVK